MVMNRSNMFPADRMTSEELAATGQAIFGERWIRPLARAIGCDSRSIFFVKSGERAMSAEMTAKVRAFAYLGPVGLTVRDAIKRTMPEARPIDAHRAAQRAVAELLKAKLVTLVEGGLPRHDPAPNSFWASADCPDKARRLS